MSVTKRTCIKIRGEKSHLLHRLSDVQMRGETVGYP